MIALFLALLAADPPPAASIDGLPIGGIARQELPAKGCAAYLFTVGKTRTLVAMSSADPALLRIALDGATADYARATQVGDVGYGFARTTEYRRDDVTATLEMTVSARADLTGGAAVTDATLRIDRAGKDSVIVPVAGLIGCA